MIRGSLLCKPKTTMLTKTEINQNHDLELDKPENLLPTLICASLHHEPEGDAGMPNKRWTHVFY